MTLPTITTERGLVKIVKGFAPHWFEPIRAKALCGLLMREIKNGGKRVTVTFVVDDYENFHWSGTWDEAGLFLAALNETLRPLLRENA